MCSRVRFIIKQVVLTFLCSDISKNNSYICFFQTSIAYWSSVNHFVILLLFVYNFPVHLHVLYVVL